MPRRLPDDVEPPPWDEIRRLYENTGIGCQGLADKFGLSSKTMVKRRRDAEGWERRGEDRIAVAALEQVVADIPLDEEQAPEADPAPEPIPEPEPGLDPEVVQAINKMEIYDPLPDLQSDPTPTPELPEPAIAPSGEAERVLAADVGRSGLVPSVADIDDRRESVVSQMADIHAERIRRQLAYAGEMQQVGAGILRLIKAATVPPGTTDPVTLALRQQAVMSLSAINPDRDTLTGLLKAAVDVMAKGISVERLALGMSPPEKTKVGAVVITPGPNPMPSDPGGSSGPAKVLKGLDSGSAWKLREVLAEASREARRRQTGEAGG